MQILITGCLKIYKRMKVLRGAGFASHLVMLLASREEAGETTRGNVH